MRSAGSSAPGSRALKGHVWHSKAHLVAQSCIGAQDKSALVLELQTAPTSIGEWGQNPGFVQLLHAQQWGAYLGLGADVHSFDRMGVR